MTENFNKKKYLIWGVVLAIVIVLLSLVWLNFLKPSGRDIDITIESGQGTSQVGQDLHTKGLITSPLTFSFYVFASHLLLQPGDHTLTANMNLIAIAKTLSSKSNETSITIPEGYRVTQIDALLAEKNSIQPGELIKISVSDEGYLFPDTYRFSKDITATKIRQTMMDNFNKKTSDLAEGKVTQNVLIIASIVEREAKFDADRARIAGVYWSRLDINMKLQADPTIQYGKGSWNPITVSDYSNFISPYNTYLHAGLPPTPICNPGLKSIAAALQPVKDGSLYFFTDSTNHAIFSKTLAEHEAKLKN